MADMMGRPTDILCGSIPYQIKYVANLQDEEGEAAGIAHHDRGLIEIEDNQTLPSQSETCLHETMHTGFLLTGLSFRLARIDPHLEEDIILALSPYLHMVFRNPANKQARDFVFGTDFE